MGTYGTSVIAQTKEELQSMDQKTPQGDDNVILRQTLDTGIKRAGIKRAWGWGKGYSTGDPVNQSILNKLQAHALALASTE